MIERTMCEMTAEGFMWFSLDFKVVSAQERDVLGQGKTHSHHVLVEVRLKFGAVGW